MRSAAFVATILTLASASSRAADAPPAEVTLTVRGSGALLVPVVIDGQGPFTFLLDTGSSHTVLGEDLVERLALPAVAQARVLTSGGAQLGLVVRTGRLSIGSASVEGVMPSVVSMAGLRSIESGLDGVVGQDFLSPFNYTVDYRRKRLRFTTEPAAEAERVPLVRMGQRPLVRLTSGRGRNPVLLVPDSGSEGFVLFEREGRTAVAVDYLDQWVGVSALALERPARGALLRELRLGTVTLRDQPAVVVRSGDASSGLHSDGLLPLHGFSSVSFHNAEGYIVVER